jgi:hypothetical protein
MFVYRRTTWAWGITPAGRFPEAGILAYIASARGRAVEICSHSLRPEFVDGFQYVAVNLSEPVRRERLPPSNLNIGPERPTSSATVNACSLVHQRNYGEGKKPRLGLLCTRVFDQRRRRTQPKSPDFGCQPPGPGPATSADCRRRDRLNIRQNCEGPLEKSGVNSCHEGLTKPPPSVAGVHPMVTLLPPPC